MNKFVKKKFDSSEIILFTTDWKDAFVSDADHVRFVTLDKERNRK